MRIAVLSGKGGTGKTFVSVSLACAAQKAVYMDCDVEEPNGHLFLKPSITKTISVKTVVPELIADNCTGCRQCVDFCQYNALALIKNKPIIFYEVCHSCGGCILFCPQKALVEKEREIGTITEGLSRDVRVVTGCLNTGEVSGVPIIKQMLNGLTEQGDTIIDCPPGSACVVMESIRNADFCVLVAEPTLFGAHNLAMVHELVKLFSIPYGVVLNKCLPCENPSEQYCNDHQIPILAKIRYDERLGNLNAKGLIAVRENDEYRDLFLNLLENLKQNSHG